MSDTFPENPQRREISQYTKLSEEGRQARKEAAAQIWGERVDKFKARRSLPGLEQRIQSSEDRINVLTTTIGSSELTLVAESEKLAELDAEMAKRSSSLTNRILYGISDLLSPPKIAEKKQIVLTETEQLKNRMMEAQSQQVETEEQLTIQEELLKQAQTRAAIDRSKEMLRDFYAKQTENLKAFKEAKRLEEIRQKFTNVGYVSTRYNTVFISGIRPTIKGGGSNNEGLADDTSWQTKLDILLGYNLELSTSTIREGDRPEQMISRLGVILRKGEIKGAFSGDMGTQATGTGKKVFSNAISMANPQRDIEWALFNRHHTSSEWNELIIGGDVQLAGLYVSLERKNKDSTLEDTGLRTGMKNDDRITQDRVNEVIAVIQALKMPLYVIENGVVYHADYGLDNGRSYIRKAGEPLNPEEILSSKFDLSSAELEAARGRAAKYLKAKPQPKIAEGTETSLVYHPSKEIMEISAGIRNTLDNPKFNPQALINIFKEIPLFKRLYESDSGVWQRYTIEQHTLMVMRQFEKYFAQNFNSPLISRDDFRVMLAMHDIGKPEVPMTSHQDDEQNFTEMIMQRSLILLDFSWKQINMMTAIACQDYLRPLVKNYDPRDSVTRAVNLTRNRAYDFGINPKELAEVMLIYYMCDAGAYTKDAGGEGLDSIFKFAQDNEGKPVMEISRSYARARENIATFFQKLLPKT